MYCISLCAGWRGFEFVQSGLHNSHNLGRNGGIALRNLFCAWGTAPTSVAQSKRMKHIFIEAFAIAIFTTIVCICYLAFTSKYFIKCGGVGHYHCTLSCVHRRGSLIVFFYFPCACVCTCDLCGGQLQSAPAEGPSASAIPIRSHLRCCQFMFPSFATHPFKYVYHMFAIKS